MLPLSSFLSKNLVLSEDIKNDIFSGGTRGAETKIRSQNALLDPDSVLLDPKSALLFLLRVFPFYSVMFWLYFPWSFKTPSTSRCFYFHQVFIFICWLPIRSLIHQSVLLSFVCNIIICIYFRTNANYNFNVFWSFVFSFSFIRYSIINLNSYSNC